MARYCIMRHNRSVSPPRHEFLRNRPDFVPGDPAATPSTEDTIVTRWTWIESYAAGVPVWRNGQEPHDFGRRAAERWAAMIDGARMARFGDDDTPAPASDPDADRRREAREAYRKALADGTAEPQ